ncbi:MAG TPA: glucuronate isomerase [Candidatus Eremiobacteraceae bacterium]|nr:glucuronate isomerase [Candidatus Eremiobacteraceae bacterium]
MDFIHDDFLLSSPTARRLYHQYAANQPILDYHSHLSPRDLAEDHRFRDLFEIWLEGDHYKWRAMRANGIAERFCTGDAPPYEKYVAWARTVPATLRNPLYHWTHLELKRYFGLGTLLDENSAQTVWESANAQLQQGNLTARGILKKFSVRVLCTVDDPCDDLQHHQAMSASQRDFLVLPTFRPDKALRVDSAEQFNAWLGRLEAASNRSVTTLRDFLDALKQRHDYFHANGCRLSDHGLNYCFSGATSEPQAAHIFANVRAGRSATPEETEQFAAYLMLFFGHLDAEKDWTKQLHLGARRNSNTRMFRQLGQDTGFDNIGDWPQAASLCRFLDQLNQEHALPRTVVYNANPSDNYAIATAIGSFQEGPVAGKVQFGSGWWFLDQKEAIEWQLNALSHTGLLSRFIGMLTDSRSFMSFPRHEYFRRILCNLLGQDVENGELPNDEKLLGTMVENICFRNAQEYLKLGPESTAPAKSPPVAGHSTHK